MSKTVLFQIIHFNISTRVVQVDTLIGPYQELPLRARAMAIKGYSAFPKAPSLLEPHHQKF